MPSVTLARHAMATRFELVLHGDDPVALRAAGEEALDEIDRLEAQLSLYRPTSEIARLNARAASQAVRVSPEVFALLKHAAALYQETGGAFDITIAPLVRCWGFMDRAGRIPTPAELAAARACVGMNLVRLDDANFTVQFERPGVMLDLGAIGKGYAVERACALLREAGVTNALLHGGTSSVMALGTPFEAKAWKVAIVHPQIKSASVTRESAASPPGHPEIRSSPGGNFTATPEEILTTAALKDEALSVSAVWGRSFEAGGKLFGHIIDPRTGEPAGGAILAAVILPSATDTDALSTALLTLGSAGHDRIAALRMNMRTLLVAKAGGRFSVETRNMAMDG